MLRTFRATVTVRDPILYTGTETVQFNAVESDSQETVKRTAVARIKNAIARRAAVGHCAIRVTDLVEVIE